jgi:hypothetical protein
MKLQQGDVILQKTEQSITHGKQLNHLILAEGEATGHNHQIVSGVAQLIALQGSHEGKRILNVLSDYALLKHQEHKEINIPKGKWEVKIVREYDHFDEEVREIAD